MKKAILCVLLTLAMSVNAFALEVPTDTVVQNLNGSQQTIKTYTIPPDQDPATLIEEPFELEGFLYTFANIVKTENPVEETKVHTEIITIETAKKDLSVVLENLEPTMNSMMAISKAPSHWITPVLSLRLQVTPPRAIR